MQKNLKIRLLISGITCLLLAVILMILEVKFKLTFFFYNLTSIGWESILFILAIILFGTLIIKALSSLKKRTKKPFVIFTIHLVVSVFILSFFVLCILFFGFSGGPKYFISHSPDKQHTIVVEEESFLLAGYGHIYEKVNAVFMTYADGYDTDDGYRPFSDNNYKLNWKEDSLTITYGFGSEGIERKVKIDFIQ